MSDCPHPDDQSWVLVNEKKMLQLSMLYFNEQFDAEFRQTQDKIDLTLILNYHKTHSFLKCKR